MVVRKIGNSWRVDFRFNDQRYRLKGPENSRAGAEAYEALLRQKLARGVSLDKAAHTAEQQQTFEQFAETWMKEYVAPNLKPSQQRNVGYILSGALVPFFGDMRITEITSRAIEQYKAAKRIEGIANKTIKNHLSVLNRCLASAYEWFALEGTPPKIKWPKCDPTEMDFLSFDECELLLSNADGLDYRMILMAVRAGLRQGELKGLQWSSIDWENRSLTVRHSLDDNAQMLVAPKSNRIRHIPIDADVYEMLYRRKKNTGYVFTDNGEPFTHKLVTSRLRKVCERAGLRKIGWHTLRHTFASHLVMKGVPLTAVKELMGHSDIKTTMKYAHLAPSTLRIAIDMLNSKTKVKSKLGHYLGTEWVDVQQAEIVQKSSLPKEADYQPRNQSEASESR
jgi:integrase